MSKLLIILLAFCLLVSAVFFGIINLLGVLLIKTILLIAYLWSPKRRKKVKKLVSKFWSLIADNDLGLALLVAVACGLMLLDLFRAIGH